RALELAASPIHYTFGRDQVTVGDTFVSNIVNGSLSRDLNTYRGFTPQQTLSMAGVLSPHFGKTFHLHGTTGTVSHAVFVGIGPYVSIGDNLNFDRGLLKILSSTTNVYVPNADFLIQNSTTGQAAAAITGGYRIRIPLLSNAINSELDGVYVAAN